MGRKKCTGTTSKSARDEELVVKWLRFIREFYLLANQNMDLIADLGYVTVGLEDDPKHKNCFFCYCHCFSGFVCEHCRFFTGSHVGRCYGQLRTKSGDIGHIIRLACYQNGGTPLGRILIGRVQERFIRFPFSSIGEMANNPKGLSIESPLELIKSEMSFAELRNYQVMTGHFGFDDCIFSGGGEVTTSIAHVAHDLIQRFFEPEGFAVMDMLDIINFD